MPLPSTGPAAGALRLRPETRADADAIDTVLRAAFAAHPHSSHTEHHIVRALRAAGALAVAQVAERDDRVVGHVACSPVQIADGTPGWYGLGPVAVLPELQGQGAGTALVDHALALLRRQGAQGCVLLGEPAFYGRFGFAHRPQLVLPGVPPEYFLALPWAERLPAGTVSYHLAFAATESPPCP